LSPDALHAEVLREFDAIVSVTTGGELSLAQETALLTAIGEPRNDRGRPLHFLGVHGASCSFANSARYLALLGGRFLRHPPMTTFRVEIEAPAHPVVSGLEPFEIYDELYVLELLSDVHVLLSSENPEPSRPTAQGDAHRRLPLGWVRKQGQGKICYLALGHGQEQLEHPSVAGLIQRALGWFGEPLASEPAR
jgi:type 1 glutamine amidotransferase